MEYEGINKVEIKAPEVRFYKDRCTLLIDIDEGFLDKDSVRAIARERGLNEKSEFHFTIIGTKTGEQILATMTDLQEEEREDILSKVEELARSFEWKFTFSPEHYYIKKEYLSTDEDEYVPDIRESIIQLAEAPDLKLFYAKLREIIDIEFDLPFPHVTLFTNGTREDKKMRGIGIYSKKMFEELGPEKL